jgi:hypothetical protein
MIRLLASGDLLLAKKLVGSSILEFCLYSQKEALVIYTACHNDVPKKEWRYNWSSLSASPQHGGCSKKTFCNRNGFLTTTIKDKNMKGTEMSCFYSVPCFMS